MRSPLRLLAAVVAVAATVGLVATAPLAASAEDDGPTWGAPVVGQCHALSMDDAMGFSDRTPAVDCATAHTSRVITTGRLPDRLGWNSEPAALKRYAMSLCQPSFAATVGGDDVARNRSAYWWFWFGPTRSQRSHGARWVSCELALLGGEALVALPTDAVPALGSGPAGDDVARCLTPQELLPTTCGLRHAHRATGAFAMTQERFPGRRVLDREAARRCRARVSTERYVWTSSFPALWAAGDRTVVCYSRTRT